MMPHLRGCLAGAGSTDIHSDLLMAFLRGRCFYMGNYARSHYSRSIAVFVPLTGRISMKLAMVIVVYMAIAEF